MVGVVETATDFTMVGVVETAIDFTEALKK